MSDSLSVLLGIADNGALHFMCQPRFTRQSLYL